MLGWHHSTGHVWGVCWPTGEGFLFFTRRTLCLVVCCAKGDDFVFQLLHPKKQGHETLVCAAPIPIIIQ